MLSRYPLTALTVLSITLLSMTLLAVTVLAMGAVPAARGEAGSGDPVTAYINGHLFSGATFVKGPIYEQAGRFIEPPETPAARTVDLAGAWVVPAFAEGHHHMVLCEPGRLQSFIASGVLYAGIMNARVSSRECEVKYHGADSVEVLNALAGITARNAHPSQIGLYFLEAEDIDGQWVHYVDRAADLDEVFSRITANPPDILKIFLSYSEDYDRLREDANMPAWYRGVDPALVAPIVKRAHGAGLRVVAHVMSAHDFDVAVTAGVDLIGHMPGFAPGAAFTEDETHPWLLDLTNQPTRYKITTAMAEKAAQNNVAVITTVLSETPPSESIRHNFDVLRAAGVPLLVGSDAGEGTSIDEAMYLESHQLMPANEILNSLAISTPQALFPKRRIGALAPGHEATFVVLSDDPLQQVEALRGVRMVVKGGVTLFVENAE